MTSGASNTGISGGTAVAGLQAANNLSDVVSAATALANIGGVQGGRLTINAQTGNFTMVIPAGAVIDNVFINETAGNAITGGLKIGTTSGATDVASAIAVGASSIQAVPNAQVLKQVFSTSATQTLFLQAVSAWNGASINVEIQYSLL